jgi:site-specific DNA-methyltransferase (adenine-specific)
LNIHSQKNDVVLDAFMGAGSTGIACLNTNRQFIGMELDEAYFERAKNRIEEHQIQGRLFK